MKYHSLIALALLWAPTLQGVNVKEFGAVGDGRADDTVALQAAIDRAEGLVELPRGVYRITRPLVADLGKIGPTSFSGRLGGGKILMEGPGPALRIHGNHDGSSGPDSFAPGVYDRERMPQIDGLEITGAHPEADGIEVTGAMQLIVRGVLIKGVRHGVRLTGRNRNVIIDGVHVYDCRGAGIYFDRLNLHQVIVKGSHISFCDLGGIRIERSEIRNLEIVGNDIEYNFNPVTSDEVCDVLLDAREGNIREGTISGNNIQALTAVAPRPGQIKQTNSRTPVEVPPEIRRLGANVRLIGGDGPNRVGKFAINGNLISARLYNIDLVDARGVTVVGNNLYAGQERSIRVLRSRNVLIANNTIDRNPLYEPRVRAGTRSVNGIRIENSDGILINSNQVESADAGTEDGGGAIEILDSRAVTVTSCQVFEPKFRGIFVRGGSEILVTDSMVLERETKGMVGAIVVQNVRNAAVRGNLVARGTRFDIEADATTVVDGNRIATP